MATKYTILETEHTEESTPYSSKKTAVTDADKLAAQYPGTTFAVCTAAGKIVHRALSVEQPADDEAVDPDPVDDVPETQVDGDDEPEQDDPQDADEEPSGDDGDGEDFHELLARTVNGTADEEPDEEPADQDADEEDPADDGEDEPDQDADEDGDEDGDGDEDEEAAPDKPAELELCAANTNAKRMHYRPIGSEVSECGSAKTTRRANQHQIDTASMCTACTKLRGDRVVDERPAGVGGRGTRKAPKRLIMDAGEVRDLVAHLKQGIPYSMELTDGTRIEVAAGDPVTGEVDDDKADMQSVTLVQG